MDPFIGQISMFAGDFAPQGWLNCDGQALPIAQNAALFAIIGTTYGGDGVTNFNLPDLRSRVPMHLGQGNGLTVRQLGERGGTETHTLSVAEIPSHTHTLYSNNGLANSATTLGKVLATVQGSSTKIYSSSTPNIPMSSQAIANTGSSQPHSNVQPFLVIRFIIAVVGIFPARP